MANPDQPQGARPEGPVLRLSKYKAGSAVVPGEFVQLSADGYVDALASSGACLGVAMSRASAEGDDLLVADHPEQKFRIQSDGAEVSAQDAVNLNYAIVCTAEDTLYKISRMELDADSGATTATLALKLLDIVDDPKNAFGANVECIVKINNHQLAAGTGTVGV